MVIETFRGITPAFRTPGRSFLGCGTAIALLLAAWPLTAFAKHSVCTATLNSHQERDLFKAKLPPGDFTFTELTDFQPKDKFASRDAWLGGACQAGVQCDVLVVSGHFGGYFFGDNTDLRLNLDPMENHACQKSCEGIIKRPKEVFLFGCNTLAEKTKDRRTPEEYLQVLLAEHVAPDQARQIVQARYGTLGDSNRDRMRRIFSGVPRIYGFDSIGPAGSTVAPFLTKYLQSTGDYGRHLADLEGKVAMEVIAKASALAQTPAQNTISSAFRTTAFTQCTGLDPNDPEYRTKAKICPLYNDGLDFSTRLAHARALLQGPDAALLAPSVMAFVRDHEYDANGNPALTKALHEFGADPKVRVLIDQMTAAAGSSPQLRLDLEHFKLILGVTTAEKALALGRQLIAPLYNHIDAKSIGQFCEAAQALGNDLRIKLSAEDIDLKKVATPLGTAAFVCAGSDDPRVMRAALKVFETPPKDKDLVRPQLTAIALMEGDPKGRLKAYSKYLDSKDTDIFSLTNRITFRDGEGPEKRAAFARLVKAGRDATDLADIIASNDIRDEGMAQVALDAARIDKAHAMQAGKLAGLLLTAESPLWTDALRKGDDVSRTELFYGMTGRNYHDPKVTGWMLDAAARGAISESMTAPIFEWASGATLDASQTVRAIEAIRAHPNAPSTPYLRDLVKHNSAATLTADQRAAIEGESRGYACTPVGKGQGFSCSSAFPRP